MGHKLGGGVTLSTTERCDNGTLSLAAPDAVELVASTWADNLAWLKMLDVPMTIYVHNRSSKRQSHCSGKCLQSPLAMLRLAAESQKELSASNAHRKHKIRFVDIPNF